MFSGLEVVEVRHGRRWTAVASFALQGILVAAALVLPMLNPAVLTDSFMRHRIPLPISLGDPHIRARQENVQQHAGTVPVAPIVVRNRLTYSTGHNSSNSDPQTQLPNPGIGTEEGAWGGINSILTGNYVPPRYHPGPATAKPRPVSVMMEGNLIHRVEPQYPAIARQIRLQGTVVLQAFVTADGRIDRPKVLSGPGILAQAAVEAVKQWQYRPYYLNGQAIEVETQITVKFILNQ